MGGKRREGKGEGEGEGKGKGRGGGQGVLFDFSELPGSDL